MLATPMHERNPEAVSECGQTRSIIHNRVIELESGERVNSPESKLCSSRRNSEGERKRNPAAPMAATPNIAQWNGRRRVKQK